MYYVYIIESDLSDKFYIGYTKDYKRRLVTHRYSYNSKKKSKLYDHMRKYGFDNFELVLIDSFKEKRSALDYEKQLISQCDGSCLNTALGGEGGHVIPQEKYGEWIRKLSKARKGRSPFKGREHTNETKTMCAEASKKRWDQEGRYPKEVIEYPFKEAKELFGISKTHYYRLLKQAKINDLG